MKLIRKIKIEQITPVLSEIELEMINFIKEKISNLILYNRENFNEFLYFMNYKNEFIYLYSKNTNIIFVRYFDFYEVLEKVYKMKKEDIINILKYNIEKILKLKILDVVFIMNYSFIEKDYKLII